MARCCYDVSGTVLVRRWWGCDFHFRHEINARYPPRKVTNGHNAGKLSFHQGEHEIGMHIMIVSGVETYATGYWSVYATRRLDASSASCAGYCDTSSHSEQGQFGHFMQISLSACVLYTGEEDMAALRDNMQSKSPAQLSSLTPRHT